MSTKNLVRLGSRLIDVDRLPLLIKRFQVLSEFASETRARLGMFTFTSDASAGPLVVMHDLKRCWGKFQMTRTWRRLPGGVWVYGDHGRPHIHLAAVVPRGLWLRDVRAAWKGGITDGRLVSDPDDLATYFVSQRSSYRRTLQGFRKVQGWKDPHGRAP